RARSALSRGRAGEAADPVRAARRGAGVAAVPPAAPLPAAGSVRRHRRPRQRPRTGGGPRGMTALARALETKRIVLCVGSGGVGKTTTAAALAGEGGRRRRPAGGPSGRPADRAAGGPGTR